MDLRKLFLFFLLVLGGVSVGSVLANSPSETAAILTEDWAYCAIADLARGRSIPNFVLFKGMTRNQGALMVARLLQHLAGEDHLESRRFGASRDVYLQDIIAAYNEKVTQEEMLTAEQVESLYRLALEFQEELQILGYAVQDFSGIFAPGQLLFASRPLLYSETALKAVRGLESESTGKEEAGSQGGSLAPSEESGAGIAPPAVGDLWTGAFGEELRFLLARNSLLAEQVQPEQAPSLLIGGLEVSGGIRPLQSGTQPAEDLPLAEGGAGYGISVKYGDLALRTAVDHFAWDESQIKSTSVDLSLDWLELFTLSAGYQHIDGPRDIFKEDPIRPTTTSLGLEVPISRGKVRLDVIQKWPQLNILAGAGDSGEKSGWDNLPLNTAKLGLSYEFENDSALRFNYKLIDFSSVNQNYGATAEFSIKF